MAGRTVRERLEDSELKVFCGFSIMMVIAAGIAGMVLDGQGPAGVLRGLWTIIISRDALITDYFELAGYGSALMNAAIVMAMGLWLLHREGVRFTGLTMAAIFINVGYGLVTGEYPAHPFGFICLCEDTWLSAGQIYVYGVVWHLPGAAGDGAGFPAAL